ncbi:uncharacterized protein LOC103307697 [Acyrthosiphon pisum]|uniref:Uncharacterized protein n=1 Tax=Acyrthosiphon pisum TaxID=7029 RepID=A0A8R2NNP8_ACYPI|nr:uncharacterized protein LOC103307697 [Acyrthosiphon pisum]
MCIEKLENGEYHTDKDGFENFQTKVKDLKRYPRNGGTNLEDYKELAQYKIKESYKSLYEEPAYLQWSTVDKSCAKAYFCHLANHVLNPEKMLPVLTWCEIHGNGTYDAFEFLRKRDNIYKKYFRRIAKDTGFERKKQTLIYRTMDVCNKEIPKKLRNTRKYTK